MRHNQRRPAVPGAAVPRVVGRRHGAQHGAVNETVGVRQIAGGIVRLAAIVVRKGRQIGHLQGVGGTLVRRRGPAQSHHDNVVLVRCRYVGVAIDLDDGVVRRVAQVKQQKVVPKELGLELIKVRVQNGSANLDDVDSSTTVTIGGGAVLLGAAAAVVDVARQRVRADADRHRLVVVLEAVSGRQHKVGRNEGAVQHHAVVVIERNKVRVPSFDRVVPAHNEVSSPLLSPCCLLVVVLAADGASSAGSCCCSTDKLQQQRQKHDEMA